jgi:hypothetical protein
LRVIIFKLITFGTSIDFFTAVNHPKKGLLSMKKLLIPAILVAAAFLLYEQSKAIPNVYLSAAAIAVFMFLMYKLNARIPHKNNNPKDSDDVQ